VSVAPAHLLILGGQRSGKSRFAERTVIAVGKHPVLVATATAGDEEMAKRIAEHRDLRDPSWIVVEEPLELAAAIDANARRGNIVLVDCLTLWLSNLLGAGRGEQTAIDALLLSIAGATGPVVFISNEVGSGIIPDNALARRYADALGLLNQRIAAAVSQVVLMNAGIPTVIKPVTGPSIAL
jgi:adenosylcobinamide kinase/adenosylcobinamide-phosphate guanylyltransferase